MKRKQKGEVVMIVAAAYLLVGFLVVVTNGGSRSLTQKAAEAPAPVVHVAEAQK